MVEIPVRHKEKRGGLPFWLLPLGLVGVLGGGLVFSRACNGTGPVAANRDGFEMTPTSASDTDAARAATEGAVVAHGTGPGAAAAAAGCTTDRDCSSSQLCTGGSCHEIRSGMSDCSESRIHFQTDSATIQEADRPLLDRMARCLQSNVSTKLAIEGNADQRGADDHNAQLAERRAMAIAHELQARGVAADQLRVVSYGENNLLCAENDADCWAKNRRAQVRPEARLTQEISP